MTTKSEARLQALLEYLLVVGVLASPLAAQDEPDISKMSGKDIYGSFCSRCHGEDGKGQIPEDMLENMEAPPPDLTEGYFSSREKRKDWEAVVAGGGGVRGLSMSMPAWGEVLSPTQISEVVDHMKSFVDQSRFPQGEVNFLRALRVTKAFVEQEFLIIPSVSRAHGVTETETVLYYADRFADRWQQEVKLPLITRGDRAGFEYGVGNLELGLKYCVYDDYVAREVLSAGFGVGLPTGSSSVGLTGYDIALTLFVAAGKEFSKLVQTQASLAYQNSVKGLWDGGMVRGAVAIMALTSDSKSGLFPGVESVLYNNLRTRSTTLTVLPKLYWGISLRGHIAVSIGPEIHVAGDERADVTWRAFFLWDYADGGIWW